MNIEKKGGSAEDVKQTKEGGELYPIRHWHQGNVWEFLLSSGDEARFALPSYLPNNNETAELYKEATGECVWTGSEKAKSACGSRFGCYLTLVFMYLELNSTFLFLEFKLFIVIERYPFNVQQAC